MDKTDVEKIINEITPSVIASRMSRDEGREYSLYRVSNWRGRGVPDPEVLAFCRAVDWKLTPHQLCARLYPHPHDGLPESMRFKSLPAEQERRESERRQS